MKHLAWAAIVEKDGSYAPELHVGSTWQDVAVKAAKSMHAAYPGGTSDWPTIHVDLPLNDHILADEERLQQWHADFREGTTEPWATFYEFDLYTGEVFS
jgi:hypothetical protein